MTQPKNLIHKTVGSLNDAHTIKGYASIFDNIDHHGDIVQAGAFKQSIQKHDQNNNIKLLWQHNHSEPIGKVDILKEDTVGLTIIATIYNTLKKGCEVIELIKKGIVNGLSIGFKILDHHYDSNNNRIITKADLWEVSIVTFPANEHAYIRSKNCNDLHLHHVSLPGLTQALSAIQNINNFLI